VNAVLLLERGGKWRGEALRSRGDGLATARAVRNRGAAPLRDGFQQAHRVVRADVVVHDLRQQYGLGAIGTGDMGHGHSSEQGERWPKPGTHNIWNDQESSHRLRLKLSGRGGRLKGKGFVLIAAAAGRSSCASRQQVAEKGFSESPRRFGDLRGAREVRRSDRRGRSEEQGDVCEVSWRRCLTTCFWATIA